MNRRILIGLAAAVCLVGCNKSSTSAAPSRPSDAVQLKLQELAGSGAKDCGRLDVKAANDQFKASSTCATNAADNKKPFYVAYDMPGMTTGVAGNSEGKLFALELQGEEREPSWRAVHVRPHCGLRPASVSRASF